MYFHLIGIKEKNGEKYNLDILLQGGDEDFIRKFLANRGVVIVSIAEFKDTPESFGNIVAKVVYDDVEITLIINGDDLTEKVHFIMFSGINPSYVNYIANPIPEDQMKDIINSTLSKINEEDEKIKKEKELEELKEQQKYEETGIKDGLKIINNNIDHIEQVIKAGEGIIMGNELKELDNYLNEMKKIRLGTNFNKMASLVLESHKKVKEAEKMIFDKYDNCKFLIDKNSIISSVDILKDYFYSTRLSEVAKLQPANLKPTESIRNFLGYNSIFFNLLGRDSAHVISTSSIEEVFSITMNLIEYITLVGIETVSLMRLFSPLFGVENSSPYLLPALGWLGLLLYLYNNLNLKGVIVKIVGFFVLAVIYRRSLLLLLNTFAL